MNKKICFFSAQYLPHVGGVERYTYNLAKALVVRGIEVTIVTSNLYDLEEWEVCESVRIIRMPCLNLMNGRFPVIKFNKTFFRLYKKLKKEEFDLVIINTRFYIHSLVGVVYGKKNAQMSIVIEHGTSHLSMHNKILDFLERCFEHGITMAEKLYCSNFYGVSEECNLWLKHFGIQAKGIFYNAIDIHSINLLLENKENNIRCEYNLTQKDLVITFVGRVLKEKGVMELIEAFDKIQQKHENTYLVLVGDGPLLEEIKNRKVENVICTGQVEYKNVIQILADSDIFCLPSYSEGMPTSVLEAIATHTFVITTAKGGAKEIITDREKGIILGDSNPKKIVKALEYVIKDEKYRKRAVEFSYEVLLESFTWDKVAENIIKIMEKR